MAITDPPPNWRKRILWFAALYVAGAGVTIMAAYALRAFLFIGR